MQNQEETKKTLLDVLKGAMKTEEEIRKEEREQNKNFLDLMSSVVTMMRPPPPPPAGPSHWPPQYIPPSQHTTAPGIPYPYVIPPPVTPHVPAPDSDEDDIL